ncbi:MAG: glycosyltransferase [Candidatus Omnitrophota bacterium]|nr:MAG: glycosyltransferase [Candidatus Omnitrophota bacterium]
MRCPTVKDLPLPPEGKTGWPWTVESPQEFKSESLSQSLPKMSIVTASYNQGQFIEETIRSVLLQGYPNLEYIIMDGGSSDDSVAIIKKYEKWLAFWMSEKDEGQAAALNKGFSKATGQILGWLNSDDIYQPGALQTMGQHWMHHSDCHFLTGDGEIVNLEGECAHYIKAYEYSFKDLLRYHQDKYLPQPSVFFSREAFFGVGGLNPQLYIALDVDLWLRIRRKYTLCYVQMCTSKLRQHDEAKTWRNSDLGAKEIASVVRKYCREINLFEQFFIRIGSRFFYASTLCRRGLHEYLKGNRAEAIKLLKRALCINPAIIFSLGTLKLCARVLFPKNMKKIFFHRT